MIRPNEIKKSKPLDPKLGIKSSLPKAKSTIALAVLLWLSSDEEYLIEYSVEENKQIKIAPKYESGIADYLKERVVDFQEQDLINAINKNQLFQSQLEALIVAFELVWKLATIKFKDAKKADSAERTGGNRYEKVLKYTSNIDMFGILVKSNEAYCEVFYKWLLEKETDNKLLEEQIIKLLNYLSDDTILKMNDNGQDIIFDMNSVYDSFKTKEDEVDISGDVEAKGALRIIKGALSEKLNFYLSYRKGAVAIANKDKFDCFEKYRLRSKERTLINNVQVYSEATVKEKQVSEKTENVEYANNRIVFGAPGTGKSHRLEKDSKQFGDNMERVTFHPNYSYAQFVGTYKPVMEIRDDKKEISYEYVPGPFMRVYLNAKKSMLVNEEYKDIAGTKVYYEPATDMDHWNLFDEIRSIGGIESFKATKDMKVGDVALIYIGNNDYGYQNGVYAIAKVISEPEIDDSEGNERLRVLLRFDKISYDKPIISKEVFDQYNTQYQSVHRIENGDELLRDISFGEEKELLLIEEINRANVAAVFGDVFQLLDRKNGISEYAIATSEDMRQYLDDELEGYNVDNSEMRIPSNMYIWATMNSADQGVFPMDTAFKRRWDFEYLSVDDEEQVAAIQDYVIPMCVDNTYYVNWQDLRDGINTILKAEKINEDKLLGPFFISKAMLDDIQSLKEIREKISSGEINEIEIIDGTLKKEQAFIKAFESKVIMYLFEDVMKMRPGKIFIGHDNNQGNMIFSEICKAFEKDGEKIFDLQLKHIE